MKPQNLNIEISKDSISKLLTKLTVDDNNISKRQLYRIIHKNQHGIQLNTFIKICNSNKINLFNKHFISSYSDYKYSQEYLGNIFKIRIQKLKRSGIKITQSMLAEECQVSERFIQLVLQGKKGISLNTFLGICKILSSEPSEILKKLEEFKNDFKNDDKT